MRRIFEKVRVRIPLALVWLAVSLIGFGFEARTQTGNAEVSKAVVTVQTGHSSYVFSIAFSPDGGLIVSGSGDNTARVWDAATGTLLRTLKGHSDDVTSSAFSPDGGRIVTGSKDKTVRVWDPATGGLLSTLKGHSDDVTSVAFSPDGRHIVTGSDDNTARVWGAATGKLLRTLKGHSDDVKSVAFSPDGGRIVTGGGPGGGHGDNTARVWDSATGKLLRTLKGHSDIVTSVAFSPDGRHIVTGGYYYDQTVRIWDAATGKLLRTLKGHSGVVSSVTFSPDGGSIVTGGGDNTVRVWDSATGKLLRTLKGHSGTVSSVAFSPDGGRIVTGSWDLTGRIWNATTGKLLRTLGGHSSNVLSVAFSPDGGRIVTGNVDKTARVWDAATGKLLRSLKGHSDDVLSVAFSPESGRIVTSSMDNTVRVWDATTGKHLSSLKRQPVAIDIEGLVESVAFSPDGKRIVTGQWDNTVRLWDPATGELLRTLKGHAGYVTSVAFSPDGKRIVTGSRDNTARVWDPATGKLLRRLKGHSDDVTSVAFSPDSRRIVTGIYDGWARVWDAATGKLLRTLKGHSGDVTSVAFSPDGKRIVTGSRDNTARVWDSATGKLLHTLKGHSDMVTSVAFSPDDGRIVTGSWDKSVRVWNPATGTLLATIIGGDGEWLAITPEGFFSSSGKGLDMIAVVREYEVFSIDQFYQALYRPDLVREKLAGDPSGKVREAAVKLDLTKVIVSGGSPTVAIKSPEAGSQLDVEKLTVETQITPQGGGVGRVEWRVNGQTRGVYNKRGLQRVAEKNTDQSVENAPAQSIIVRQELWLDPGENDIEVVAYNEKNLIASEPVSVKVTWAGDISKTSPRLHVLSVGVNDYFDSRLRLNYGVPDAKALSSALQAAGNGFYESVSVTTVLDDEVTTGGLEKTFTDLASKIRPRDVFVFFLAGHGKTVDGKYYFIPQDFRYKNPQSIVDQGIGQDKWQGWFSKIPARKSILFYDTCESGSLTGQRIAARGMERVAALEKLTRAMGRTVLSAATDDAPALEGYRGHGVFTYALLDALSRSDNNKNGLIEVTELAGHIDATVPEISHEAFGYRQIPQMNIVGSDFAIVRQVASVASSKTSPQTREATFPFKPTHVVITPSGLFEQAGGDGVAIETLKPGTVVTLIKTENGWTFVAKDGKRLGYVAAQELIPMQ